MDIYITLDYELFFGNKSGSVSKCIIEPTNALLKKLEPLGVKINCFVDAGYLYALRRQKEEFKNLEDDYYLIKEQLQYLTSTGHSIQLHVHPHWEDTFYKKKTGWVVDTSRYKISDFSDTAIIDIFSRYTDEIVLITKKRPIAYRAGGWCAQPFSKIKNAFIQQGIFIDSTVYSGGIYKSDFQYFDFTNVPMYKTEYSFSSILTEEDINGKFKEIPISSFKVSPIFFWKFIIVKLLKQRQHIAFGDGEAIKMKKSNIFKLLCLRSHTVVSIDGYKSILIERSFKKYVKNTKNIGNFVLIGHPKAFTTYSLAKTKEFVLKMRNHHSFVTYK